jgi:hypothetical protein
MPFMLITAALLAVPASGYGQADSLVNPERMPRPETRAVRASSAIDIDGRVDEPAWAAAVPITGFIQAQPNTGAPATERTLTRVLYDDGHLYISAICHDSDSRHGLVIKTIERDYPNVLSEDMDSFGVSFDTFLDRRSSFLFFVNPRGGVKDGQTFNDGTTRDYGWDGLIDVRTTVHDSGWTVEMAIPWTTLRFDPTRDPQAWGVNFLRRIRRKNEVAYWAPLARRDRIFLMSQAGTLHDLPRVSAGRNLWLKPFGLMRRSTGAAIAADTGNHADGGIDLKFGITPRTTLDLTWRTDFSDADVDQEQINLTRFPTFFPEQREFFLENSGTFTFGDVTAPGAPRSGASLRDFTFFHSRTIGLRSGRRVPLFGGGRLTGRAGPYEFGLLNVQADPFAGSPEENFSVVRLRRNFLGNADVGILAMNRQATGSGAAGEFNRSIGADLNLRLAQFLFVSSYLAHTRTPTADDEAARLFVGWRDPVWDASAMVRQVGDAFTPGMGFIRRRGIRQWYATAGAHPRPRIPGVLEINPFIEADYQTDLDGRRLTWDGTLGFGATFRDGGTLSLRLDDVRELLDQPFDVRPGVTVPAGDYHFREAAAGYNASEGRMISGSVGVSGGGYYQGSRFSVNGSVSWQPDYHLTLDASVARNAVSMEGTEFTADLYTARVRYAYSTSIYLAAFVQYNADTDQVVTNLRLNVIHAPLSDFFLVFTERRDVAANALMERVVTAKVTKLFAF